MQFTATISASKPGAFETIATYRGELGAVRRKASRKLRQWKGQAAMRGAKSAPSIVHNWGESWEGTTAQGNFVRLSSAITLGRR